MPPIWVGLFLLLLLPLVVTPSTLFPFVVGKATYFRGLVEILFALWVLVAVASPRYRLGRSWILSIFAIYVLVNLAAALMGVSFQRSFCGDYRRMGGVCDLFGHGAGVGVIATHRSAGVKAAGPIPVSPGPIGSGWVAGA